MDIATNVYRWFKFKQHGLSAHTDTGEKAESLNLLFIEGEGSIGVAQFEFVQPRNDRIDIESMMELTGSHFKESTERNFYLIFGFNFYLA